MFSAASILLAIFFGLCGAQHTAAMSAVKEFRDRVMGNVIQDAAYSTVIGGCANKIASDANLKLVHEQFHDEIQQKITEEQKKAWYMALHEDAQGDPDKKWMEKCQSFMIDFDVHLAAFQCLCSMQLEDRKK